MPENAVEFAGGYQPTPAFQVNGEGFDASHARHRKTRLKSRLPAQTLPAVNGAGVTAAGTCLKKPWEYEITAAVPTLNASERLPLIIELLRLQTARPYILLVDTGSRADELEKVLALRAQDVEVFSLKLNGVRHWTEPVAYAMDAALGACRTRFLFATHDDCFLRSRIALQYFRDLAAVHKVAGHHITPRPQDDWPGMVGHTATMFDADWLLDRGITWNVRRGTRLFGQNDPGAPDPADGWPDTEIGINYLLRQAGVWPFITGREEGRQRNKDGLIDHCRSHASNRLYAKGEAERSQVWIEEALREGWERVREWGCDELPDAPLLPRPEPARVLELPHFTHGTF